jgi:hypothetical protein
MAEAHRAGTPSSQVLRWAAGAVQGKRVLSIEDLSRSDHRGSGTFRLRIERPAAPTAEVILKVPVPGWIDEGMVVTNARALRLAETHRLAAPLLVNADLDGRASGTVASLETVLSGSSDLPRTVSRARLREAGAAIARVHALPLESQTDLPHRPRPCAVDDRAAERRQGRMPTTPLLQQADQQVSSHGPPAATPVFLHGDVWGGNMLWENDRCIARSTGRRPESAIRASTSAACECRWPPVRPRRTSPRAGGLAATGPPSSDRDALLGCRRRAEHADRDGQRQLARVRQRRQPAGRRRRHQTPRRVPPRRSRSAPNTNQLTEAHRLRDRLDHVPEREQAQDRPAALSFLGGAEARGAASS